MERKEIIDGLKDLIKDRESFITEGESESWKTDTDKIFEHDKQVLEEAINTMESVEDAKPTCKTTGMPCCRCQPVCEHRG